MHRHGSERRIGKAVNPGPRGNAWGRTLYPGEAKWFVMSSMNAMKKRLAKQGIQRLLTHDSACGAIGGRVCIKSGHRGHGSKSE